MIVLSIIIPFFNTFSRSERVRKSIINTLEKYNDIEFLLINDGSTDDTLNQLQYFFKDFKTDLLKIVDQDNQGPGGARNAGLEQAKGKYIWFVDSDDDFFIEEIYSDLLIENDYDFIDYDYIIKNEKDNSMGISSGVYLAEEVDIYLHLGRIWSKIFKREFWIQNKILYPTHCIYEDNQLIYILPIYINKFLKSDKIAYYYHTDYESVTRSYTISDRFYDRIITSYNGVVFLYQKKLLLNNESIAVRFKEIFLYNSIIPLIKDFSINKIKRILFIMSTYKYLCRYMSIPSFKNKIGKRSLIDVLVFFIPAKNKIDFFLELNKKQWKK